MSSPSDDAAVVEHDHATDEMGAQSRDRSSRWAAWGLVGVLVVTAGFPLWSSQYTARVSRQATSASRLSNSYAAAAKAVAAEESFERKYRLEPGPEVRSKYDAAATSLVDALETVKREGSAREMAVVDHVLRLHGPYLEGTARMFAAVDRGDNTAVLAIDSGEVDPLFGQIEQIVDTASDEHHADSLRMLDRMGTVERFVATATPVVFLFGLMFVVAFASLLRRVRHQLDNQRGRALHDSLHDALTGLPNRVLLSDRFEQALRVNCRNMHRTGLLLIDLDRFKEINDTLGHHYGDELLMQIGPRLATALRDVDTVARLGGDEFAVLLPEADTAGGAVAVAARLRDALGMPFVVNGVELGIDASIGVVVSGDHGEDVNTLLQRADIAMYVAKEQGIGVCAYDPSIDGHSRDRLSLLGELRHALDRGEFFLHYQPKVSLSTGELCGVEALIRWQHPTRGLVPPDDFIPLAEHTALIGPLTSRVLDLALSQVRAWLDAGYRVPVAVNLSARNMLDEGLPDEVIARLAQHDVPAALLELEITESAIMTEAARARELLTRLHDYGIRIAIDDFGAGYTSLSQLKTLPVSELKVDRSFVMTMDTDPANALIVRSVIDLGHNLGLTAIAEGVETAAAMATLADYGCDIAQGYHLCRPGPAEALGRWLESSSSPDAMGSVEAATRGGAD
jgi:diguanylate cyclase